MENSNYTLIKDSLIRVDFRAFQPPKIKRLIILACTSFLHLAELACREDRSSQHSVSHHKHDAAVESAFYLNLSSFRGITNLSNPALRKNASARLHYRHSTSEFSTRVNLSFLPQDESTRAHVLSRSSCNMRRRNPRAKTRIDRGAARLRVTGLQRCRARYRN